MSDNLAGIERYSISRRVIEIEAVADFVVLKVESFDGSPEVLLTPTQAKRLSAQLLDAAATVKKGVVG